MKIIKDKRIIILINNIDNRFILKNIIYISKNSDQILEARFFLHHRSICAT